MFNRLVVIAVQRPCEDSDIFSALVADAMVEYAANVRAGHNGQDLLESMTARNGCTVTIVAGEQP